MTVQTGRTTERWTDFRLDDSGGVLRSIPVDSINGIGLDYDETELVAFQDAIKGVLPALPSCTITITGPFDNTAAQTAGTLSGSFTVLYNLPGGVTPLSLAVYVGMRHAWEVGEPSFGLTSTGTNGFLCKSFTPDGKGKYTAVLVVAAGSAAPAWVTAAIT